MATLAAVLLALILALVPAAPARAGDATPAASPVAGADRYADLLPAWRDAVGQRLGDSLSSYEIRATVDPGRGAIGGAMDVEFVNDAGISLSEVWFRLYPNIPYYGEGSLSVGNVTADGEPAATAFDLDDSALRIDLPRPLLPGQRARIAMAFETIVPADSAGSFGIFQRDTASGAWILSDWHPVLAVYDPGVGWNLAPATSAGDPTYAASAWYDVALTHPVGLAAVASGVRVEEQPAGDGLVATRFIAGPAREFTLALDDNWVSTSVRRDGVTVTAWTEPETDPAVAQRAAKTAADAMAALGQRLAPYPYREIDLVQAPLDGALAVSWAGLIFLDGESLLGWYAQEDPEGFDTVVAHEVGHLWWGAMIGSDSNASAFVNEGLATVASIDYLDWTSSPALPEAVETWVTGPARQLLERGDAVVDLPAGQGDPSVRTWAVYAKAALGFFAIRRQIGDDAFAAALREVARDEAFGIITPDDLRAAFERASGQHLNVAWDTWFHQTEMTREEIDALGALATG